MKKVTLKFKKSDFKKGEYLSNKTCAISSALTRAGYPHLNDYGIYISNEDMFNSLSEDITYGKLTDRVFAMYQYLGGTAFGKILESEEPKAFQITILLDIPL